MDQVDLGIEGVTAYQTSEQGSVWLLVETHYPSPKAGAAWHFEPYRTLRFKVDDWQSSHKGVAVSFKFTGPD